MNVLGGSSPGIIERQLDEKFGHWYNAAKGCYPGVNLKVIVPPDWEVSRGD
jgi:hypothetical protein